MVRHLRGGVHTLRMVEKHRLFDWHAFPLFTAAHDIITAPETLNERMEEYLQLLLRTEELPEYEQCDRHRLGPLMPHLVVSISGHGFGHVAQTARS